MALRQSTSTIYGEANERKLGLNLGDRDLPDPMGKDQEAFTACAVLIEAGTAPHVDQQ
ncbi:hypothetical protein ABZ865_29555 [Streptomyces sp. NPDC047085]|uniref:hypothetical protein n=1 Tax=Streptomyces sp. NPDC047085 TaxID=3155140 RepID=UPI0033D186AA